MGGALRLVQCITVGGGADDHLHVEKQDGCTGVCAMHHGGRRGRQPAFFHRVGMDAQRLVQCMHHDAVSLPAPVPSSLYWGSEFSHCKQLLPCSGEMGSGYWRSSPALYHAMRVRGAWTINGPFPPSHHGGVADEKLSIQRLAARRKTG